MTDGEHEAQKTGSQIAPALSKTIHMGIPIASVLLVLAFAIVSFQPAYKSTIPPESTLIFIPVYLTIVVILVFSSMYLFKRLVDGEPESSPSQAPSH
jgi:flagellar biosynthesis protein FliQ